MSKFVDRLVGRTSRQEENSMARQSNRKNPPEEVTAISRLSDYTAHPTEPEAWPTGDDPADYGKLGEHVTAVLEAANQAATKIRNEARGDAKEIAEAAQREAASLLERARSSANSVSDNSSTACAILPGGWKTCCTRCRPRPEPTASRRGNTSRWRSRCDLPRRCRPHPRESPSDSWPLTSPSRRRSTIS